MSEINVAQPALSQGSATVSPMGQLLGYARVSTADQQLQVDALRHAGGYRVFTETASGARADRPVLDQLLTSCAQATPSWSGSSTGSAAPFGTWSTALRAWLIAASASSPPGCVTQTAGLTWPDRLSSPARP